MIKVYRIKGYTINNDKEYESTRYATLDFINRYGLSAIDDDVIEVSESDVDALGVYITIVPNK